MFKLSMKMLKREYKNAIFYIVAMTIAIMMTFVFFSIIFNQSLDTGEQVVGGSSWAQMSIPVADIVGFVVLAFCGYLIFYVNNYYILNKQDEIAIMTTSGANMIQTTIYLCYQTALLFLIALIPGVCLGILIINKLFAYIAVSTSQPVQSISMMSIASAVLLIFALLIMLIMMVIGYVHRTEVKDVFYAKEEMSVSGVMSKIKLPFIIFVVIFILSTLYIYFDQQGNLITTCILIDFLCILAGVSGAIATSVANFKKMFMHKSRYATIALSNLSYMVLKSKLLMLFMMFSTSILYYVTILYKDVFQEHFVCLVGYIIVLILMATTIMYNNMIEAKKRQSLFVNMWKVGYTKKELHKICRKEVLYYYLILIIFPVMLMLSLATRSIALYNLSSVEAYGLIGLYVIVLFIVGIVNFMVYQSTINESIVKEK